MFGRVTKEVRSIINASPFWTELPLSSTGFLASLDGFDSTTDDAEVVYADDVMHAFTHKDAGFVAESVRLTASVFVQVVGRHGLTLNFGPGKTEAVLSVRGTSAKAIRKTISCDGGLLVGAALLRVVCAYKHLGTLATSTGCPAQDAARGVAQGTAAYAKVSGKFISSALFDVKLKIRATGAVVDSTLLRAGELWTALSLEAAQRIEAVHMRWLRKATGHFRAVAEDRMCDEEVRITYEVPSTRSLLLVRRLMYLASFRKASPFLRALLQHGGRLHPWVLMIQADLAGLQMLEPKFSGLPSPYLDVDAWARFACDHPGAWRRLLRVLRSPSDPDGLPSIDIECPICTKVVAARGARIALRKTSSICVLGALLL